MAAFDTYRQPDDQAPNWGRAETHVWLGKAESHANDLKAARTDLSVALKIAPDYQWAKALLAKLPASQGKAAGAL